ncbi:MAG: tail fiber domain-containing protein [Balneolaceae bacterium]|nr:tail fiber domain-containing protein [Balneolaceae bacterium]
MKKLNTLLFITLLLSLFGMEAYAQVPQGFNFQAVATGADGTPIAEQEISVQIEIVKGTDEGDIIYTETHSVTTNVVGLFQLTIGQGTAAEGNNFSTVDWGSDNYFVGLGIDETNSGSFVSLGKTRLLSVPYALLAQDVVNGTGTGGELDLSIDIATTDPDTSLIINVEGEGDGIALQAYSKATGSNRGIWGEAVSDESNTENQRGVYGMANGSGTGQHIGLFGGAVNFDATGSSRRGVYGQAASKSKYNYGMFGIAAGEGDGTSETDPENGDFGSFNVGGYFQAYGNLNGNVGLEGVTASDQGSLRNFGVIGTARTSADGRNIGGRFAAFNSSTVNVGAEGVASGGAKNIGVLAESFNGTSNIGLLANGDTAAVFNGTTVINGDLTVNGAFNGAGGGSANGSTLDSLFFATPPENEFQRNSFIYPGYQRYTDQDGNFSVLTRGVLQYGNYNDAGVYNWYNKGGMQVASENYPNGEQAAGMTAGRLYMDIFQNESFYETVNLGTTSAAEGGRTYFNMSSLAKKEADGGDLFSINIVNDANGNDPNGEAAELFAWGESSPNIQMGGMQWENADHGYFQLYGSTQNGDGWYHTNYFMGIGSDGTHEWTNASFMKTDIANQSSEETISIDGNSGTIRTAGLEIQGDLADDQKFYIGNGSISGGQESYTNGFVLNHNASGGSVFEMYSGGTPTVGIFSSGNANFAGTVTQSSDLRLKSNVSTLSNALDNTLALRGVSYTWKDSNKTQATQIGVIAQEVEEIYPELVRTDDEGMKSVNYTQMVAVLIEAVKELNAKIEVLESENTELQAQVDDIETMKAQINQLMTLISGTQSTETPHSANK